MDLEVWVGRLSRHRRAVALVALIVAFTGVSMILNSTHWREIEWIGISLLLAGSAMLALAGWPKASDWRLETRSLGSRLVYWLTWQGRLVRLFPVAGIGLIVTDLAYNFLLSSSPDLLTEDIIVLLTAAALIAYGFIPGRYARERDFALLFFVGLDLLLVIPLLVVRQITGNFDASVDVYSWTALAPELSAILSFLGVVNSVHAVYGFTAPGLTFTPIKMTTPVTLLISTSCSGIYSFGIFASAYAAFLLTEYERPSRRLWTILTLGFLASYVANLLRMVIIVLIGFYSDSQQSDLQNLLLAHSYAGWLIFLAWLALFWGTLLKFLQPGNVGYDTAAKTEETPLVPARGPGCCLCGKPLTPIVPASRCACGTIYHMSCTSADIQCPSCHRYFATGPGRPESSPLASQPKENG
jgi:exosortase/archaeosortase family protein